MTTVTDTLAAYPDGTVSVAPQEKVRIAELDALRGCAALAVVGYHLRSDYIPFGWAAVDLFFVLSGFLITSIIIKSNRRPGFLKAFYWGRSARIFPIYYVAIACLCAINLWLPRPYDMRDSLPWYATYTQNAWLYWGGDGHFLRVLGHTWTLAIEEQFYLLWPLLLMTTGGRLVIPISIALIGAATIGRLLNFHDHLLLTRCDGFAFGAIGAAVIVASSNTHARSRLRPFFLALCGATGTILAIGSLLVGIHEFWRDDSSFVMRYSEVMMPIMNAHFLGVVGCTVLLHGHWLLMPLRAPWLCYIGRISYGIYLYHWIVINIAQQFPEVREAIGPKLWLVAVGALSILVAALSWHMIEQPILILKDRLCRRGVASVSVA